MQGTVAVYVVVVVVWLAIAIGIFVWSYRLRPNGYGLIIAALRVGLITAVVVFYFFGSQIVSIASLLVFALSLMDSGEEDSGKESAQDDAQSANQNVAGLG